MNVHRIRLINAARKALFQRTQLRRSADGARNNFAPEALKQRAKSKAVDVVDTTVANGERLLRNYSLPLGLAAVAGMVFAFRRPLQDAAHALAEHFADEPLPSLNAETEAEDEPV